MRCLSDGPGAEDAKAATSKIPLALLQPHSHHPALYSLRPLSAMDVKLRRQVGVHPLHPPDPTIPHPTSFVVHDTMSVA
jgi:hypothetical protein